jgi:hypothetical protein
MNKLIRGAAAIFCWAIVSITPAMAEDGGKMHDSIFIFESWTADGKSITSYVGEKRTVVQDFDSLLVIDYEGLQLVEYHTLTGTCEKYSLNLGEQQEKGVLKDDPIRQKIAQQLGMAKVEKIAGRAGAGTFRKVALNWGSGANLHRTVAPPSIIMYGRTFTPERELYLVDDDYEYLDQLFKYGDLRDSVLAVNPLLSRLDISGQVSLLAGVPVQVTHRDGTVEKFGKVKRGSSKLLPPEPEKCH